MSEFGADPSRDVAQVIATLNTPREHERMVRVLQGICLEVLEAGHEGADPREKADVGTRFVFERESPGESASTGDVRVITGGRDERHHIPLHHPSVSENHFEIRLSSDGVMLRDLGSRNGTWVGRARLADGHVALAEGASFWAGSVRLMLTSIDQAEVVASGREQLGTLDGQSQPMRALFAILERLGPTPIEVLVEGETGTGKEEVARTLHRLSTRSDGPFVVLDCAALAPDLAESTIFGHKRGSFTGAVADQTGCFEMADGGTLFLDEIGELPPTLQPKLLRVLERREVVRLGEHKPRSINVRILSATNRDLRQMVKDGTFREDLFHRIACMRVVVPALRERLDDVPLLARRIMEQYAVELGRRVEITDDAIVALKTLAWAGNVRQLKKVLWRTAHMTTSGEITAEDLKRYGTEWARRFEESDLFSSPLKEARDGFERRYCVELMRQYGDNLALAAEVAGYTPRHMRDLLRKHDIKAE